MDAFWEGFHKRAEDPIADWQSESMEAEQRSKKKTEPRPDLTTERHGFPPDTYWRSWP